MKKTILAMLLALGVSTASADGHGYIFRIISINNTIEISAVYDKYQDPLLNKEHCLSAIKRMHSALVEEGIADNYKLTCKPQEGV